MKFTVTCLVSSVNSSLLDEKEAVTKDVVVANPKATVQNLRAIIAIQFRLNVVAFDFRFDHHAQPSVPPQATSAVPADGAPSSSSANEGAAPPVDFSDEKQLIAECGLEDGDHLTVLPRQHRSVAVASGGEAVEAEGERAAKKPRIDGAGVGGDGGEEEEESALDEEEEEDEEDALGDSGEDSDEAAASAQNDLFEALHDVVPDLTVLRNEFLTNPQAVMERIERNHPSLFQVIAQNQETFVRLMNNEQLTKAAQSLLHGGPALGVDSGDEENSVGWSMGEEDEEEMDEETEAQMSALFQNYIAAGGADGDFDVADLAALEASGMVVGDVDEDENDGGDNDGATAKKKKKKQPQSEMEFILARVPSEEDEKKIQALTELGFTYEQCKLAFYLCHRSIDRASNMLFEAPPQL